MGFGPVAFGGYAPIAPVDILRRTQRAFEVEGKAGRAVVAKALADPLERDLARPGGPIALLHELHDRALVGRAGDAFAQALRRALGRLVADARLGAGDRSIDPGTARNLRHHDPVPIGMFENREALGALAWTRFVAGLLGVFDQIEGAFEVFELAVVKGGHEGLLR